MILIMIYLNIILIALVNLTNWGFVNSVTKETTIFVCRTAQKTNSQPELPKDKKTWSNDPAPLAPTPANPQITKLKDWLDKQHVVFDILVSSDEPAAIETASKVFPDRKVELVSPDWKEVRLGFANGMKPEDIKKAYAEYHPGEEVPDDANDCLNESWPITEGKEVKDFEPYNTAFKVRILKAVQNLHEKYPGKTVVVFTHCEDMRDVFMLAKPTEGFIATELGEKLKGLISDPSRELGESIKRPMFKPDYASGIKLTVSDDKIAIEDTFKVNPTAKAVKKD